MDIEEFIFGNGYRLIAIFILAIVTILYTISHAMQHDAEIAFRDGQAAYKTGITSESNPYAGDRSGFGRIWLNGWIAERNQDSKEQVNNE